MSAEEAEASFKDTQIGNKEQQEQTTRSGLVAEEEDQEDHLGREGRKDHEVLAAFLLVVGHATSLADQAATMTMTMMTVAVMMDQVGRAVGSSAHEAPIQREPTRHSNQHEMRLPTTHGDSTEALVEVHLQQLLRNREEFFNL